MSKSRTTTTVSYTTQLRDGIREDTSDPGQDEPFVLKVVKESKVEVFDGRGRNWDKSHVDREELFDLSLAQAGRLAESIVDDLAFAATVAQRRVLAPEEDTA